MVLVLAPAQGVNKLEHSTETCRIYGCNRDHGRGRDGAHGAYLIYPTEYENIGYIVHTYDGYSHPLTGDHKVLDGSRAGYGIRHQVRFVFMGQMYPGTYSLSRRQIARAGVSSNPNAYVEYVGWPVYYNAFSFTVTGNTCIIDDKTQTVHMRSAMINSFTGVGTTVGAESFSVNLSCGPGVTVSVAMTDANSPSNITQTLTLNESSSATGVGVQLFANNNVTPVTYGPTPTTDNMWLVGGSNTEAAKVYNIPFVAKYIQTKDTVTVGTVNSMATVSLYYK
ncbi:fimbrial protein [Vibrio algarum]|uniref:Fimbrial protein n=1 Tax=Vibrio algarum TaxID=3020714 RepID=A0ABT4YR06_9VIBR|nr:fimbrial protein [Vibrio sp. KJ40-1]MDB1123991.1 fimbrial protein [Vibrio sp. KJ40-1]